MSDPDSEREQNEDDKLNIEKLISEIERRPALYNKQLREYCDRNLKEKLWGEVSASVTKQWSELSSSEKQRKVALIQKKWKNVRDCFIKEISSQIKTRPPVKKRKYIYYDSLKFLIPFLDCKLSSAIADTSESLDSENYEEIIQIRNSLAPRAEPNNGAPGYGNEEYHFAMMLVPMLQSLNEDQKHYAKIEILNVIRNVKINI